jgi:3-hydroxyisobutyrate dehydrogenase-like beta-hydroxyacid dehydrogenase
MGATVACVGMGLLGSALAENLIRAGFTVRGYDVAPERVREHVGPNGSGARAKLVVNLVLGLNRLALAEGLLFGLRQGLDGPDLLAVLKDSAAYSTAMDVKGERMLTDRFEPEGKLAQHLKDVELMLEVGHAAGAPLLATALHRQLLTAGVAGGWGERDNSSIIAVLRSLVTPAR